MTPAQPTRLVRCRHRRGRRRRTGSLVGPAIVIRCPARRPSSIRVVQGHPRETRRTRSSGLSMTRSIDTAALRESHLLPRNLLSGIRRISA